MKFLNLGGNDWENFKMKAGLPGDGALIGR